MNTGTPDVFDLTVKVTMPLVLETPDAAERVSVTPLEDARVTILPETGLELTSFKVTVKVEVVLPLAVTEVGLAAIVD